MAKIFLYDKGYQGHFHNFLYSKFISIFTSRETLGIPFDTLCRCNDKMDKKRTIQTMLFHTSSILIDNSYQQ